MADAAAGVMRFCHWRRGGLDPFEHWAALQASSNDETNRLDEAVDLAFWDRAANGYDDGALATRMPAVLERVRELIPAGSTVLDVGAGTGSFALPLAAHARSVTALDYSPAMLNVLAARLADTGVSNVQPMLARWEDAPVASHDVVLAANALYRVADARRALSKIVDTVRKRGIIVWSVGRRDAAQRAAAGYRPGPDYVHAVDALFGLDVFANVELLGRAGEGRVAVIWWDRAQA